MSNTLPKTCKNATNSKAALVEGDRDYLLE